MTSIGFTLLWCMLQVTVISTAAVLVYFLASRAGATARGGVAIIGLITAAALVPLAFLPWPRWDASHEAPAIASSEAADQPASVAATVSEVPSQVIESEIPSPWTSAIQAFVAGLANPQTTAETTATPRSILRWPLLIVWLFAGATIVGLLRFVLGTAAVRRSIRRAKPVYDAKLFGLVDVLKAELSCMSPVEIRESADIATAAMAGWRRPVLLLPPDWHGWSEAERRAVLAHELAHVKRRDYLTAIASQAALAVHFYHPLLHWLAGRVRLEQELAADALAATVSGGRAAYLRTLAELALRRSDGRVAWPARAFLPSRRTFLRRIEMLRDPHCAVDRRAPLLRTATAGSLLIFSLIVAGIRPDLASAQPPQTPGAGAADRQPANGTARSADDDAANASGSLVAFIPPTATWVVTVRPIDILTDPAIKPFAAELEEGITESQSPVAKALRDAGVTPRTVEALAFGVMPRSDEGRGPEPGAFAFRLNKAADRSTLAKQADETKTTFGGIVYRFGADGFVMLPDDRTVLMTDNEDTLTGMIVSGQVNRKSSPWTRGEEHLPEAVLAVLLDTGTVSSELQRVFQQQGPNTPQAAMMKMAMGTAMPLLQDTQLAGIALTLGEGPGLRGYAACQDESGARRVRETLEALLTIAKNTLRQAKTQIASQPPQQQALAKMFLPMAETLLNSAKVETKGTDVTLTAESDASAAVALGLIMPAIHKAREAARRAQAMNSLKQIALAFHNYHDTHGYFPPAVIEENGVTRSWRVEILPYLEEQALYDQYRKDQPWDSEANKKVLAQMPALFKDPSDPSGPTSTSYYVVADSYPRPLPADADRNQAGLFSENPVDLNAGGKGPQLREITDGTSNTLLVVEAQRNVPWTKPEDISFDPGKIDDLLKDGLGGNHPGGFLSALCDGSVHFFESGIDAQVLKTLFTAAGGEVVDWPGLRRNGAAPSAPTGAVDPAGTPPLAK